MSENPINVISICGVLVHTANGKTESVKTQLNERPGVEVHASTDDGRLVVTVEGNNLGHTGVQVSQLQDLDGVLSTSMVYQYNDEACDSNEERL